MKKAILYKKLKDKKVKCLACSWYCEIAPDKTGVCGVRKNINGELHLLVYARPVTVHVDPIEKKPLFHFLPGMQAFSLGTVGCNFACDFCQNWDISQASKKAEADIHESREFEPLAIVRYCKQNNIPIIAFTYNEPSIFFEYAYDTMKLAHREGIKNVWVSNGYFSKEALNKIKPYLDGINIDLKAFKPEYYQKLCHAKIEPVLENIKRVAKKGIWLEVTTLILPGENDSDEELEQIAQFIASVSKDIPWHISAFHPDYKMTSLPPTSARVLVKAYEIGKKAGLKFVYTGNIPDEKHESTYCPKCGELLIKRSWYNIEVVGLRGGKCKKCGEKIPGVWK